jgi:hypothetical protein
VAFGLHSTADVVKTFSSAVPSDRRWSGGPDRRRHSRSGRRKTDPHMDWRRIAWLFGAYAACMSVRSLTANVWKLFKRDKPVAG